MMGQSIMGRAQERGYIRITAHQIRDYTTNKQMQVDDYPYGGGRGAVMQADPLYRCWDHICQEAGQRVHTIYLSPCGRVFNQEVAKELKARYDRLILVCGHYEGVDQRFLDECVDEEISMGDFVLTGGEIPAMAVADCLCAWCRASAGGKLLHRREPLERPAGISPVFPPRGVARPGRAAGAAVRPPRQRGRLAEKGELQAHHGPPPGYVRPV